MDSNWDLLIFAIFPICSSLRQQNLCICLHELHVTFVRKQLRINHGPMISTTCALYFISGKQSICYLSFVEGIYFLLNHVAQQLLINLLISLYIEILLCETLVMGYYKQPKVWKNVWVSKYRKDKAFLFVEPFACDYLDDYWLFAWYHD